MGDWFQPGDMAPESSSLKSTYGWKLSYHARQQAARRGIDRRSVLATVADPDITYPQKGNVIMKKGMLALVTDPDHRIVITVLLAGAKPWNDADCRAAFAS